MENFKFVGIKYKTENEKQKILQDYDEYQMSKVQWINNKYNISDNTKDTYLKHYNNNFHRAEKKYGKDLKFFTKEEIENTIIETCVNLSMDTIMSIGSFCSTYCNDCVLKGDININPYKGIKLDDLVEKKNF